MGAPLTAADRHVLQDAADDADRAGRLFAVYLQSCVDAHAVSGPILSRALSIVLAGLIVDLEGPTHDAARLTGFTDQVRATLQDMRADRDAFLS